MENALVKKSVDKLKAIINQPTVQEQFKNALGKHSDLFVASLIDVFNSGLQDCDPKLVIQEALKAAVLKLPISKSLGFSYLVPYNQSYKEDGQWKKNKVPQFQIGYKGLIQLAMRSGQLRILNPDIVCEGEFQGYNRLTGELDISGEKTSDEAAGYFVYMELINGFNKTVYWSKEKVISHAEKYSQAYQNGIKYNKKKSAWFTDFDAMAIKTVLKATLGKYAPLSVEFIAALEQDTSPIEPENIDITSEAQEAKKPVSFNGMTGDETETPAPKKSVPKKAEKTPPKSKTIPEACAELDSYMKNKSYVKIVDAVLDAQGSDGDIVAEAIEKGNVKGCEKILKGIKAAIKAELEDKPAMP